MQRIFSRFILLAALYVSAGCTATHAPEVAPTTGPSAAPSQPLVTTPTPAPVSPPAGISLSPNAVPHIALLLPLKSPSLGEAAEVVEQGFMAANNVQPGLLPIRVYSCADEEKEIVALYRQALSEGARAVVGPLTPAGVAALAAQSDILVPTLALNRFEGTAPEKMFFFGLSLENEARQIARLAASQDQHIATIVSTDNPLSNRLVQAFSDEWKKQGGEIAAVKTFNGDTSIFSDLPLDLGSMVFVAANAKTARIFRPYLNAVLPVYATSQIFNGNSNALINYDLRDVIFVDMPWLLQPDHPAVMIYPRPNPPLGIDMDRLYALGIDSFRLMRIMLNNSYATALPLDGVTGSIHLSTNHQFEREAVMAEFKQGLGLTPAAYAALNADKAAGSKDAASPPSASH